MLLKVMFSTVLFLQLGFFHATLTFKMCGVRDSTNIFHNGWLHVIQYVNEELGGLTIGSEKVNISVKDNVFVLPSASVVADWYQKWDENIAWGCQVALCQSDVAPFVETAAYLEARGVMVMMTSGTRWTRNPDTGMPWKRTWNGAISSALYHRGLISIAAFQGAKNVCTVFKEGWSWGTIQSADVVDIARNRYSLNVSRISYNHSNAPTASQKGNLASMACLHDNSPGCETTYMEPYNTSTWATLLEACGSADVLIGYVFEDGISLARYIWERGIHFKAIYMVVAPGNPYFTELTGEAGELIVTPSQWDSEMVASCEVFGSNANFTESFEASFGRKPHYMEALTAFDAVVVVMSAQAQASVETEKVNAGIQALDDRETFFGRVQWGLRNMQGRDPLLLQVQRGRKTVVEPREVATNLFAFPIPTPQARSGCPMGTWEGQVIMIREEPNVTVCRPCRAGRHGTSENQASPLACRRCPLGKYAAAAGQSECTQCPMSGGYSMTTSFFSAESLDDCRCADTFYRNEEGICAPCPLGMECPPGADGAPGAEVVPLLRAGYWSDPADPWSVFTCHSENHCPGGVPGTCAPKVVGRACSYCIDDWVWSDNKCVECSGADSSVLVFPILAIILLVIAILAMYLMFKDQYEDWGRWSNGIAAIGFIVMNHYQVTSLLLTVNVSLPSSLQGTLEFMAVTSDLTAYFRPECVGFVSFESRVIIKSLLPLFVLMIAMIIFLISNAIVRYDFTQMPVAMELNRTLNAFFSLIFTFFAGIAALAFELFKSSPNPNGKKTLSSDRAIIFGESDWMRMIVIGVIAVLFWCVGFLALICRAIVKSRTQFHEPGFAMRWKFLFIKYRSEIQWWAVVILAKSICLNLVGVIFVDAVMQIYAMLSIIIAYCASTAVFWPWRHIEVNICDIWAHLCLIVAGATLIRYAKDEESHTESLDRVISHYGIVWLFMVLPVSAAIAFHLLYEAHLSGQKDKPKEIAWIVDANRRLAGLSGEDSTSFFRRLSEWDYQYLKKAQQVVHTELAGMRSRQGYASQKLKTIKEIGVEQAEIKMNDWLNDGARSWPTVRKKSEPEFEHGDDGSRRDKVVDVRKPERQPERPSSAPPITGSPGTLLDPLSLRSTAAATERCGSPPTDVETSLPGQTDDGDSSICTLSGEKLK